MVNTPRDSGCFGSVRGAVGLIKSLVITPHFTIMLKSNTSWGVLCLCRKSFIATADVVFGGICVVVWGRDLGLSSEVRTNYN